MKLSIKHKVPFDLGDYAMFSLFIVIVIASSLLIISEASRASHENMLWQQTQAKVDAVDESNTRLHEQATRLSRPERLQRIADEHGLTYNKDNVKYVK